MKKKSKMIAVCGIDCSACEALLATQADDDEMRARTALSWTKIYGGERTINPSEINCRGCRTGNEILFSHCHSCEMRACAGNKAVSTCAHCPEYTCDKLEDFFKQAAGAREGLEIIREEIRKEL